VIGRVDVGTRTKKIRQRYVVPVLKEKTWKMATTNNTQKCWQQQLSAEKQLLSLASSIADSLPYAENKVEHKMNLVRIGHKGKNIYFSAKR
jgi:hypothetical protein